MLSGLLEQVVLYQVHRSAIFIDRIIEVDGHWLVAALELLEYLREHHFINFIIYLLIVISLVVKQIDHGLFEDLHLLHLLQLLLQVFLLGL